MRKPTNHEEPLLSAFFAVLISAVLIYGPFIVKTANGVLSPQPELHVSGGW